MKQQESEEKMYQHFLEDIVKNVRAHVPKGTIVQVRKLMRNNGCVAEGLEIRSHDTDMSPAIYLRQYFDAFRNGADIQDLSEKIIGIYLESCRKIPFAPDFFNCYSNLSGRIVYKIINYYKNQELLQNIPHMRVLDLAVVYYCLADREASWTSFAISNDNLLMWGIPEEKLFREAAVNTPKLLPPKISPLREVLSDMMDGEMETAGQTDEKGGNAKGKQLYQKDGQVQMVKEADGPEIYVLTNEAKIQGAACMLYENVLQDFAEKRGSDLVILPSSVHEVLLVPARAYGGLVNGRPYRAVVRDFNNMVASVNETEVAPDEVLSNHIYIYDRAKKKLCL